MRDPYAASTDASRELHARTRLHKEVGMCTCSLLRFPRCTDALSRVSSISPALCPSSRCSARDISFSLPLRVWYAIGTRLVAVISLSLSLFTYGSRDFSFSLPLRVWYPMVFTLWRRDAWKETHGVEEHSLPATASTCLYRVKGRNRGHVLGQTLITQGPIVPPMVMHVCPVV